MQVYGRSVAMFTLPRCNAEGKRAVGGDAARRPEAVRCRKLLVQLRLADDTRVITAHRPAGRGSIASAVVMA